MAEDVQVKFGADAREEEAGAARVVGSLREVRESVNQVAETIQKFATFAIIGSAIKETIEQVYEFIEGMAELGDVTEDTAAILGVATDRIGELQAIAMGAGDNLQGIAMGMERLAKNESMAAAGGQTQIDTFARMGVSIRDSNGRLKDLNTLMGDVADSMAKHSDGAEKVSIAMELMGRSGARLIPILNDGREGFKEYEEMAHRTGTALSEQTVRGMHEVHTSLVETQLAFQGLGVSIFNSFQPAINAVLKTIADLVERLTSWITKSYDEGGAMRWLALMVDVVVAAIMTLISAFELLWDVASMIIKGLGDGLEGIGKGIAHALAGDWGAILNDATDTKNALVKTWQDGTGDMATVLSTYKDNIKAMFDATINPGNQITVPYGEGGGKSPYAPPTDLAAQKAAMDALKQQLQQVQQAFQQVFSSIIGGFDKAISGLITGTMTWKQAMFSVLDGLWSAFVKFLEDWLAKWLASEAMILVAHQTTNAEKVASDLAAQNTGTENMILNAIKAIFVSSQQTAAGVTANLAPALGPLAVPAGIAAGATVAGMAAFDVGSWSVPGDQVAQVHDGEMIIPAKNGIADMMRDMLTGKGPAGGGSRGGGSTNFYGPVLDKTGLARMVAKMQTNSPSLRGDW